MGTERELPKEFLAGLRWLEEQYLLGTNPRAQSGTSSNEMRWRSKRRFILDAIDRDGDVLDVGCANGHLLESLMAWGRERGLALTPYGVDYGPRLIELARTRLPQCASHFYVGNAWEWQPPRQFRFVYTLYDCVPPYYFCEYVERLLDRAVEPGGRLIIGGYSWFVDVRAWLQSCGFVAEGRFYGVPSCGGALGWVDKPL
jgi:SAM-dependent methyltransferase